MFFNMFRKDFVLAFELFFQTGDPPILGIPTAARMTYKRGHSVLQELVLPALEHRESDALLAKQIWILPRTLGDEAERS